MPDEFQTVELAIAKLRFGPGDVLAIKANRHLSRDVFERITLYAKRVLGDDTPVLVLDGALDIAVLTKAEIDARAA